MACPFPGARHSCPAGSTEACWRCRISSPTPNLCNQGLHYSKTLHLLQSSSCKTGTSSQSLLCRLYKVSADPLLLTSAGSLQNGLVYAQRGACHLAGKRPLKSIYLKRYYPKVLPLLKKNFLEKWEGQLGESGDCGAASGGQGSPWGSDGPRKGPPRLGQFCSGLISYPSAWMSLLALHLKP